MEDAWHIIKWAWLAVLSLYFVVQVFAVRRLKGDQKRRSNVVLTAMLILMGVSDAVRAIFFFENRTADRIGMFVVASGAIVATIVLTRVFRESPVGIASSQDRAESTTQSLNLS